MSNIGTKHPDGFPGDVSTTLLKGTFKITPEHGSSVYLHLSTLGRLFLQESQTREHQRECSGLTYIQTVPI